MKPTSVVGCWWLCAALMASGCTIDTHLGNGDLPSLPPPMPEAGIVLPTEPEAGAGLDAAVTRMDAAIAEGPFDAPRLVEELSVAGVSDDDPTLTADMLEIFFESGRTGGLGGQDIWTSKRQNVDDPWDAPVLVEGLNSEVDDATPAISADGLHIWYSTAPDGNLGPGQIWTASRTSRSAPWSAPRLEDDLNIADHMRDARPTPDLLFITLTSIEFANGNGDLFFSSRADTNSAWAMPQPITELNTLSADNDGHLLQNRRIFYFSSTRNGNTSRDLFWAGRDSADAAFSNVESLDELNSDQADGDPWLSPDGHTIYFTSNREGDPNIYIATR